MATVVERPTALRAPPPDRRAPPAELGRCESCRRPERALFPVEARSVTFKVCADCRLA